LVVANQHAPTAAFYLARWVLQRLHRGYGRPFSLIPVGVWGGAALTIETEVGPMLVPVRDLTGRGVLIFGCLPHEVSETRLLRQLFQGTPRVIDVGASIGWYSVLACNANPGVEVHAFEANPDILPYLQANASGRAIHVHATAVSDRAGVVDFFCAPSSALSSVTRNVGRRTAVPAVALDDLSLGPVDFIKLDVEGGELAVLRGARRLRAESPHAVWMIEADERMLRESGESLEALDEELDLSGSTRLYTVDTGGGWQRIKAFSQMRGAWHKNVLVVPGATEIEDLPARIE
jgi:FkbM family methyltransferase